MGRPFPLDRYLAELWRVEAHRTKGVEKEIRKVYKAILKDMRAFFGEAFAKYAEGDRLGFEALQRHGEYARFLEGVQSRLDGLTPKTSALITQAVEQAYNASWEGMVDAVRDAADDTALAQKLSGIRGTTPQAIRRAVENPVSGLTLKDTLEKNRKDIVYNIKQAVGIGLTQGDRYTTMAKRISACLDKDYRKSITIARTETHRVVEAGHHDAAQRVQETLDGSGMELVKTWKAMQDERVRRRRGKSKADHRKMDGVTIPVDGLFDLGRGIKTPAPLQSGDAANDINCRCYLSYSVREVEKTTGSGIIKLPKHDQAVIPVQKFTGYALNPEKDPDKARAFREALGYHMGNADKLIENIRSHLGDFPAREKPDTGYGKRYEVLMELTGENGKRAKVMIAWIADKQTGELRLTSAYVTNKKR